MVTVISKRLADQLFPNADAAEAIGKRLTFGAADAEDKTQQTLTIVGVTGDFPTSQMSTEREQLLLPLAQHPSPTVFLIARISPGELPMKLNAALENAVRDLGPDFNQTVKTPDGVAYSSIVTGVWLRFDVVKLVMPGVAVGLVITAALVHLNGEKMGIALSNVEPLAYVVGAAIAVLVAVLASLAPARRAASVQPMVAMRSV
jgi:hypothetical protein